MALLDRPLLSRLAETIEDYAGWGVRPTSELQRAQVVEAEYVALAGEAEILALHQLDYYGGRPGELTFERRRRIAQQSRIAFKLDPLAGAEAQLLGDFGFGKGVPQPTARDRRVQQIIDEAWTDANNEEKLTGFQAQRKLSNELLTTGELFITLYVSGGRIRVGRLDPDTVEAVVPDPNDRLRPLWYLVRRRQFRWDFQSDMAKISGFAIEGRQALQYWKHWRNLDDALRDREMGFVEDDAELTPPAEKIATGVVYHLAINQTGEESRGNPPWARSLRFFSAMNELTSAHVAMAQAASTFIGRQTVTGGPRAVTKAATQILGHVSELGAATWPGGRQQSSEMPTAFAPTGGYPPAPGSWFTGNDTMRVEALALSSGAAQMQQTAQIVRAPISAAAGFGQHYLGDASSTNLATASTLELPATMRIEAWQEYFAQVFRWFTDRAIEAAVKAGRVGSIDNPDAAAQDGPLGDMRLHEAEDRVAMERRVGVDLSYDFVMPYPGRRALPDVQGFLVGLCEAMDPNGVNVPLRRALLTWALGPTGIPNIGKLVDESIPEGGTDLGVGPRGFGLVQPPIDPAQLAAMAAGGGAAIPGAAPAEGDAPANVRRNASPPADASTAEQAYVPPELRAAIDDFEAGDSDAFRAMVVTQALSSLVKLGGTSPALATSGAGT